MGTKCKLLLTIFLLGLISANAMFRDLPWTVRRLFPEELIKFYNSISEKDEKTLLKVFVMAQGDADRADKLVQQVDPTLYGSYSLVFPVYYAKLNALSPNVYKFYKQTVLDKIKHLIRKSAFQYDFFKHFAVINAEWEKLSEDNKAEFVRAFPSVAEYLDDPEFKRRSKLGADYD